MGVGGNDMRRLLYLQDRDLVPVAQQAEWAPGLAWKMCRKSLPHQDSTPRLSSLEQGIILTMIRVPSIKCVFDFSPQFLLNSLFISI